MKVLFVYPNVTRQTTPQLGIASLLSLITSKYKTLFFDLTFTPSSQMLQGYLETFSKFKPDVVMVSCRTNEWGLVKNIIEVSYPTPTIIGGIHPTVAPEEVLRYSKIIVRGEAEGVVLPLLDKLNKHQDISKLPNVWYKSKGKIHRNDVTPLLQDLDQLPMPTFQAFRQEHFYKSYIKALFPEIECVGTFETSRGCPYSCTYCCNDYLQTLYKGKGKYHRQKSPARVKKEIDEFKKLYPDTNFLYFVDDTFLVGDWIDKFAEVYDKTPFVFMTRVEQVTPSKMKLVASMGAKAVSIGIESGNEKFRKRVLNRHMSNEQIVSAFRIAKEANLRTYSFNMVGLPGESKDDILSTIKLNKRIKPDIAQFTIFMPLKGTKLYDICIKEGLLNGEYPELFNYYGRSFLKLPGFKDGEIAQWVKKAEKELS